MILRRLTDAFRKQDWFTVLIETLIVVLGVFLGLQVNNWNAARAEREQSQEYLSRIRADLVADMTELRRHQDMWQEVANEGYVAIHFAETGETGGATDWEILRAFLNASQAWQFTFIDSTYSELRSAGELKLIPDNELRSALADYYVLVAARRGGLGPYHLLPEYREKVRGRVRSDILRYYWDACFQQGAGVQIFIDCPPPEGTDGIAGIAEQLAADTELLDGLRYWADTQRQAVELAGFDLDRAQAIIDRVDSLS
ncbi:MAG: hypothetical protein KDA53_04330 [Hyphomonas sp.]|nr:hypothetical protein [Hyphomonas sp.]